ncbi:MAG: glutamine-hydrolyzing GMP synthase [Alistipes inops]
MNTMQEKILILDFGSQYTQLIARRVRELNVYCRDTSLQQDTDARCGCQGGDTLSGSPYSVRDEQAPHPELGAIKGRLPLLGVCYGAQWLAQNSGGQVEPAASREYGRAMLNVTDREDALLKGMPERTQVWMSHGDTITLLPAGYRVTASTDDVHNAAFRIEGEPTWGIQFHPEVYHSTDGLKLLENFVAGICGCRRDWSPESFVDATVRELREKLGDDKVVLGLSGGVDSSVAAILLHRAIGKNLYCIFVDTGLLRKNELRTYSPPTVTWGSTSREYRPGRSFWATCAASPTPKRNAKSSAATSSRSSTRKRKPSKTSNGWHREPSIRMSSNPCR